MYDMKKWIAGLATAFTCTITFAQDIAQLKNEQPFRWTGVVNAGNDYYANSGDVPVRSDRYAWRLSGNPTFGRRSEDSLPQPGL
jgi:hypothetical protein